MNYPTPEAAHTALIEAIDYELAHYGPASLADMVASLISARYDEDEPQPTDQEWIEAERTFEKTAEQLAHLSVSQRKDCTR